MNAHTPSLRHAAFVCLFGLLASLGAVHAAGLKSSEHSATIQRETRDISGWQVHINKKLLEKLWGVPATK